jgi:hypothetical protein
MPYSFQLNFDTNRIIKYFLSMLRFETESLGQTTIALANSALLPQRDETIFICC